MPESEFHGDNADRPATLFPLSGVKFSRCKGRSSPVHCVLFAALLLTLLLFGWGCGGESSTPVHLVGKWETADPKYKDRYLSLTETTITYGAAEDEKTVHFINKVVKEDKGGEEAYTFHYRDSEGEKWTLSVRHPPGTRGRIQLQNSRMFWNKSEAGGP